MCFGFLFFAVGEKELEVSQRLMCCCWMAKGEFLSRLGVISFEAVIIFIGKKDKEGKNGNASLYIYIFFFVCVSLLVFMVCRGSLVSSRHKTKRNFFFPTL